MSRPRPRISSERRPAGPRGPGRAGRRSSEPPGARRKTSLFLITINTNRSIHTVNEADYDEFNDDVADASREMWENDWQQIIRFVGGRPVNWAAIESIHVSSRAEVGERFHRVHAHIVVKIVHRSRIHLNVPTLKRLYQHYANTNLLRNIAYCFVRAGSESSIEHYIDKMFKDPATDEPDVEAIRAVEELKDEVVEIDI